MVGVEAEVDAGAGGTEAVAGADVVALGSATGTADDLGPRGTCLLYTSPSPRD